MSGNREIRQVDATMTGEVLINKDRPDLALMRFSFGPIPTGLAEHLVVHLREHVAEYVRERVIGLVDKKDKLQ